MSDGSSLKQSCYDALAQAESHFQTLLTSTPATDWRRMSTSTDVSPIRKTKGRLSSVPELADVVVHRKPVKSGEDIYRLTLEVSAGEDMDTLEPWETVFSAPEVRKEWDPAVVDAHLVETFDPCTRICKTKFTLGWPANPRDAVTISRSFRDQSTFIDVATSLPRSPDEPVYLRPSPPYVRSNVTLFAWCIQHLQPTTTDTTKRKGTARIRITCFWQHDLRSVWNMSSSAGIVQQLSTMVLGLFKTVKRRGSRIPKLMGYGNGVTIERVRFQIDREALAVDYAIIPEDDDYHPPSLPLYAQAVDEKCYTREHQRLTRSIECILPASAGWDVQVSLKGSSPDVEKIPWQARAAKRSSLLSGQPLDQILLRISHNPLTPEHAILKVHLVIEISGPSSGLRLNGIPHAIADVERATIQPPVSIPAGPTSPERSSAASMSFQTSVSSFNTAPSVASSASQSPVARPHTERTPAIEKSILSRVKRNYIYFSSLLQEPEAKWKRTTEARGVTITQLDSIDPTLVVYRAEATFVGVGLWDLYGAIATPGAKNYWDKQHEDAVLLEDVNDLTELWHLKTKPAWPVNGRDAVVLKTVYKSSSTIHVFSFSADDPHLFPSIPPADLNVIRTQIDLQGFAIEALSPTTTQVTLLEQSDPKGWTNKTSIPHQMIGALAGIGEFTIKCGGPPFLTRLAGAKANEIRYDHERMSFRIEYEVSVNRMANNGGDTATNSPASATLPIVECELRCDLDTWASSLDIVIDPPPQSISALRRHRYSCEGGGLWLTIIHDAVFVDDERLQVIVRRGPGKEKGLVMVNGAKVNVDVEELPEAEIKSLAKRKRVKPTRIPLDQPPVVGAIRKRRAEWDAGDGSVGESPTVDSPASVASGWAAAPKMSSPLTRFFSFGGDTSSTPTQSATVTPELTPSASKVPIQYALEGLAWVQDTHLGLEDNPESWVLVNEKGVAVHRKLFPELSPTIPVHKSDKVIEGVSAEELAGLVMDKECRRKWDTNFDGATVFESFGADCQTAFATGKAQFPFRDRGFFLAGVMAKTHTGPTLSRRNTSDTPTDLVGQLRNATYCVQVSFSPESVGEFQAAKYNPYALPIGRVFVDAWVLETLDPYTTENYAVPSSRCIRLVAVDYAGSIPAAMNSLFNAALARSSLQLETFVKGMSPVPLTRLPPAGLVLVDRQEDSTVLDVHWKLRRRDQTRTLVLTEYSPVTNTYRSVVLLEVGTASKAIVASDEPTPTHKAEGLPVSTSEAFSSSGTISGMPELPISSPPQSLRPKVSSIRLVTNGGESTLRGSPAFTLKGEPRHVMDLLVTEVVVDTKLYPEGYTVFLKSRSRTASSILDLSPDAADTSCILPLVYTIHTIPLSPLHSSGMNGGQPTQHLLRLTLPTAQYEISSVRDPLTGEMQSAPPKPQWLVDMEDEGSVVDVEVRPGKGVNVQIGEEVKEVKVIGEKESLTELGREELLDDRVSKMNVLSRSTNELEVLPKELTMAVAVNVGILDPSTSLIVKPVEEESTPASEDKKELAVVETLATDVPSTPITPSTPASGFLSFLQSYQNPLARFSIGGPNVLSLPQMPDIKKVIGTPPTLLAASSSLPTLAAVSTANSHVDDDTGASTSTPGAGTGMGKYYPLSTVLVIALIAFLIGSLLRSLLSPADFIYVVTDLSDAEEAEAQTISGWREIRRLFEVKYVFGGWDFQVAVVRRH